MKFRHFSVDKCFYINPMVNPFGSIFLSLGTDTVDSFTTYASKAQCVPVVQPPLL